MSYTIHSIEDDGVEELVLRGVQTEADAIAEAWLFFELTGKTAIVRRPDGSVLGVTRP